MKLAAAALLLLCQGAPVRHWAYVKPVKPVPPAVKNSAWVRNPIDAFIMARLEREGLAPSPEASRETLLRRVCLDLTGLPPSADAPYDVMVDRLLASPHYGERWARPWLDLARYADTDGFNFDRARSIWKYRDWVIDALNRDMPFDQFTIEQIAGDMLPNATLEQRIATGFHRNTMTNDEGGVDKEEARWDTLVDRVNTTGAVWLGSTLACAQCHNHKYDPFKQREYFQLLAFFDNSDEPKLEIPTAGKPITTLVLRERASQEPPSTHMRIRGAFVSKGDKVSCGTPAALHPMRGPSNRLGLARWLVDEENPLTARVTVNRIWEQYFGRGLVETVEDFGTQGAPPDHPELLDWLATELVRLKWSLKDLHRTIVTSSTYRQSSRVRPDLLARDPRNVLLARGPRFRMDPEMLRDQALFACGRLNRRIGGPPVYPLQASMAGFVTTNKVESAWPTSKGEDLYRRSIYTFWRRTSLYPAFATFDAPTREVCSLKRGRTNTPLQALAGLNDPAFFDAARKLAERVVAEKDLDVRGRVAFAFRCCTARLPDAAEIDLLVAAVDRELPRGELAAWTLVANVLLNLDETLTKE